MHHRTSSRQVSKRTALWHYEHRSQPLLSQRAFLARLMAHGGAALVLIVAAMIVGAVGYHGTERMPWIDAVLNAAMILSGMGPVGELHTTSGKLFATFYSLFSGVLFLVVAGTLLGPVVHRLLHRLHMDEESKD